MSKLPIYIKVARAAEAGKTSEEIMAEFNLTALSVTNARAYARKNGYDLFDFRLMPSRFKDGFVFRGGKKDYPHLHAAAKRLKLSDKKAVQKLLIALENQPDLLNLLLED